MDSDTDHFESADEDFISDQEENKQNPQNAKIVPQLQFANLTLAKSKEKVGNLDSTEKENNSNVAELKKQRPRKERPQKIREPKSKLGIKLGTKIEKNDEICIKPDTVIRKDEPVEFLEDWGDDWSVNKPTKIESDLYSEKFSPDKNFWEKEEDYMELPPQNKDESNSWGWGNWGSSLLSTAQMGVSTITSSVSQGITTVLESGIGVPDPEELAKLDREQKPEENIPIPSQSGFGLGNLVSGVSHITKLVETTGSKVLTGGLDTLEVIGKKTMEVLQEGDPGLKKKRALFKIDQNKPVLSQILREAKEKAEQDNKLQHITRKPHYETIFDDYQGLVHLEALEMLSKQCDIKLETLLETLNGNPLQDMQETMSQIKELCELPDEDEDSVCDFETVEEKLQTSVNELNIQITYKQFLDSWKEVDDWLLELPQKEHQIPPDEDEIHQKAIESLAQLTAIAVEQFHKAAELLLVKERRSTVDEADSLVQLTIILTAVIGQVAGKFSEKLNGLNSDNVNSLITNIFLEAANSSSYIQDAFNLMVPVLQVGAI